MARFTYEIKRTGVTGFSGTLLPISPVQLPMCGPAPVNPAGRPRTRAARRATGPRRSHPPGCAQRKGEFVCVRIALRTGEEQGWLGGPTRSPIRGADLQGNDMVAPLEARLPSFQPAATPHAATQSECGGPSSTTPARKSRAGGPGSRPSTSISSHGGLGGCLGLVFGFV
jgi:hypothetical protein